GLPVALADNDDGALGAGHAAADAQQIALAVHKCHLNILRGDSVAAHVASHALALVNAAGRGGLAAGAWRAGAVGSAVRLGLPVEMIAFDGALEALALAGSGHIHMIANGKYVCDELVGGFELGEFMV